MYAWSMHESDSAPIQKEINRAAFFFFLEAVELRTMYCACCWLHFFLNLFFLLLTTSYFSYRENGCERVRLSSDILRPFMGEGNMVAWLNKLKLLVKLQKIENVATLILIYLEGNVLTVYLEMGKTRPMLRVLRKD